MYQKVPGAPPGAYCCNAPSAPRFCAPEDLLEQRLGCSIRRVADTARLGLCRWRAWLRRQGDADRLRHWGRRGYVALEGGGQLGLEGSDAVFETADHHASNGANSEGSGVLGNL